jgi:hypothetical protein
VAQLADYRDPESEEEFELLVLRSEEPGTGEPGGRAVEGEFLERRPL